MAKAKILKFLKVCFRSIFGAFQKCIPGAFLQKSAFLEHSKSAFQKCIPGKVHSKSAFLEAKPAKKCKNPRKSAFLEHSKSAFQKCIPGAFLEAKPTKKCKHPRKSAFLVHSKSAFHQKKRDLECTWDAQLKKQEIWNTNPGCTWNTKKMHFYSFVQSWGILRYAMA